MKLAVVWGILTFCWVVFFLAYCTMMNFWALWPFSVGIACLLALLSWGHWRKNRLAWWMGLLLASIWLSGGLLQLPSLVQGLMAILFTGKSVSWQSITQIRLSLFDFINVSWFVSATTLMIVALSFALSRRGRATYTKTKFRKEPTVV